MPKAYLVTQYQSIAKPGVMPDYAKLAGPALKAHGGRFLVRGGAHQTVEGDWKPNRVVVLEFPSMEQAKRWYDSEEYREPKAMRLRAGRANLIMVEGVS